MSSLDPEIVSIFIEEALELLQTWEATCFAIESDPRPEQWGALFRLAHNLKGSSKAVGLMEYGSFIHKVEDLITALRDAQISFTPKHMKLLLECHSLQEKWITGLKAEPGLVLDTESLVQLIEVELTGQSSELPAPTTSHPLPETQEPVALAVEPAADSRPKNQKTPVPAAQETIRVATGKIDSVIKIIGEISIYQNIINHQISEGDLASDKFTHAVAQSSKLVSELQNVSQSLRMNAVGGVFQRLERIARDVASELGKRVRVVTIGADVELDKSVLDRIVDPLTHIVRNAVDHGLETTEGRREAKKSEDGILTLEARQSSSGVVLVIRDDGRGLDRDRILKKAVSQGLIKAHEVLTEEETFGLIMKPGFSTAEKLTSISGRGVGMDIVKNALQELHGDIEIQSVLGKGTTFVITLPTDLSIVDVLIARIHETDLALPIGQVSEVVGIELENVTEITPESLAIRIRDKLLPLEKVQDFLPSQTAPRVPKQTTALVIEHKGQSVALTIPRILGKQTVVVRPLGKKYEKMPFYAGATILGNGEPSFVVDLNSMAKHLIEQTKILKSELERAA